MLEKLLLSLDGEWKLSFCEYVPEKGVMQDLGNPDWIPAKVPGAIHYALMDAGRLENIYGSSKAAEDAGWVSNADWIYRREFDLSEEILASPRLFINFSCVDTFSDVFINGKFVGSTDNMYVPHMFDIRDVPLTAGCNIVTVRIKGHERMVAHKAPEALQRIKIDGNPQYGRGRSLIRRHQRSYQADLLNMKHEVLGIGLVGKVDIVGYPEAFIDDFHFRVRSITDDEAVVDVDLYADTGSNEVEGLKAEAILFDEQSGPVCAGGDMTDMTGGRGSVVLHIHNPQLWWPRGYGEQKLYRLVLSLYRNGVKMHSVEHKVGIKKVELVQKTLSGRSTFYFMVNGVRIYPRGANLMPLDCLNSFGTDEEYENLLKLSVNANMNMIRLWGGGVVEPESFLSLCDRMGMMVWKDFHLHSGTYPDYDDEFVSGVEEESEYVVKQIRNHPCFTVICGGNEQQEGWDAWGWKESHDRFYGAKLIYEVLPVVAGKYCPEIPYIPNSPFGKKLGQSPVDGDAHTWGNYFNATKDPQFVTETCWYAGTYSRPGTLEAYMGIKVDEFNYHGWHHKWKEITSLELINCNQYTEYHKLGSLREYLYGLEIEQMQADYHALYMLRCRSSSCNGILYWPLNKGGPLFTYGCLDYKGYPLMPYYLLRRLYADVVVNVYRDIDDIRIVASNAGLAEFDGSLGITHFSSIGRVIMSKTVPVRFGSGNSIRLHDMGAYYANITDRWREAIHVCLETGGRVVAEDTLYFCPLYEFEVYAGGIGCTAEKLGDGSWLLEIETEKMSKMIEIEGSVKLMMSDNYFTLLPGVRKKVVLTALDDLHGNSAEVHIGSLDTEVSEKVMLK